MEFQPVDRAVGAFQESVSAEQITAMCHRAFGTGTDVVSAIEFTGGSYNNTYRVDIGADRPVILRVAPAPERQSRIERELMRNEHAALPFYAPVSAMMPRTLCTDWTRDIAGRDYMWQTMLGGVSAMDGFGDYPRSMWAGFYRQLGTLTKTVHSIRGERFGPVAGPTFATWSDAVLSLLGNTVADLTDAGLDVNDLLRVVAAAEKDTAVLDEIDEPRMLHGDLFVPNVMLAEGAPEPLITGMFDHDRSSWGDPAADWGIYLARLKPGTERDGFWETYGPPDDSEAAAWRTLVYRSAHIGAVRLERHRMDHPDRIPATYDDMRAVLDLMG
ncbi:MAG TPA: aminoglycoside phosphotransferase family protein [Pseudonocardiaceae bacterium]|nr:aminoglycoside phosphotransferase family protein [Pseudonocardiaceae bacterium]